MEAYMIYLTRHYTEENINYLVGYMPFFEFNEVLSNDGCTMLINITVRYEYRKHISYS